MPKIQSVVKDFYQSRFKACLLVNFFLSFPFLWFFFFFWPHKINKDAFPFSLTKICFGHQFNKPITHLPPSITHLIFGYAFNQPVPSLPSSLTHLTFGYSFDHPVLFLPPSLTYLTFGVCFSSKICLVPSVKHLSFGMFFSEGERHGKRGHTFSHLSSLFPLHSLTFGYSLFKLFFSSLTSQHLEFALCHTSMIFIFGVRFLLLWGFLFLMGGRLLVKTHVFLRWIFQSSSRFRIFISRLSLIRWALQ